MNFGVTKNAMLLVWLTLLSCALLVVNIALALWPESVNNNPLMLHPTVIDLGTGALGEQLQGQVSIRNLGDRPARYKIEASCACTDVTPRTGELRPGEVRLVSFFTELPNDHGVERSVRLVLVDAETGNVSASCLASGRTRNFISLQPESVSLRQLTEADVADARVEVEAVPLDKTGRRGLADIHVALSGEDFDVEQRQNSNETFTLIFSLKPDRGIGNYSGTAVITIAGREESVGIPLFASVVGK